jgi:MFS transporter, ACS family, tartrate transporter
VGDYLRRDDVRPRSQQFYLLRFLLGAAEAGFFPGIVLYLTYWVPQSRRSQVMATFLTSTATSGIIGNPLAGLLMKMDGLANLHGWQWLFLLEGIVPVVLGVFTWLLLPDEPSDAKWLSESEKQWLAAELARDHAGSHHHVANLRVALGNARLWLFATLYFLIIMGLYGFVYWVPTIIKSVTPRSTNMSVGLFAAIPYLIGAVTMVQIGRHADRHNERRRHIAICALLASIGVTATCFALSRDAKSLPITLWTLCVAAIGIFGSLGPFWALATRFLRGASAAGGIAIVNSVGGLAGFVAPYAIGYIKQTTRGYTGLLLVSTSLFLGSIVALRVPKIIDRPQ